VVGRLIYKIALIIGAILFWGMPATYAQTIDQLISQLHKSQSHIEKIDITTKLAFKYQNQHAYNKAIEYYRALIALSKEQSQYDVDEIYILKNIAFCYEQTSNLEKHIATVEEILNIYTHHHQNDEIVSTLKTLSILHIQNKDFKQSLAVNHKLLELVPSGNILDLTQAYNNLGYSYKKIGDEANANKSFNQCYDLFNKNLKNISAYNKIVILLNLGVMHAQSGYKEKAQSFFDQALEIAEKDKNNLELAKIYNYKAAYEVTLSSSGTKAITYLKKAINLLEKRSNDLNEETQLTYSYKLLSDIYHDEANWPEYVKYNKLYIAAKDISLQKEKRLNQLHLEKQLNIEKKESQLKLLIAEKEKKESELKSSQLEKETRDKELALKEKELTLLKQNQVLQSQIIKNEQLEKERVEQLLIITNEKNKTKQQEQEISLLQKNKELQKLLLMQRKKENQLLEYQVKINKVKLQEAQTIRLYFVLMVTILGFLVILSIIYYRSNRNKNKELAIQNRNLTDAQKIINAKNEKLRTYSENLENLVQQRTQVLTQANNQLIKNNNQLEQFAYILAHNIKAPIARLIGLGIIFKRNLPELSKDNQFIVGKIDESVHDLNQVVRDLNIILEIKSGIDAKREKFLLKDIIDKIKLRLESQIAESHAEININIGDDIEVYSVKTYIESIVYNLISNAIKYRAEERTPIILISFSSTKKYWTIHVKDNGLGIDLDKFKDKIYGLYKRFHSHVEGKGMGLYLVKVQAESLDGKVECESIVNEGSVFEVTIPFVNE
jgi:signal transduction histidine kinase